MRRKKVAQGGFSYVEILVSIALIAVCLAPMLDALKSGTASVAEQEAAEVDRLLLQAIFEDTLRSNFNKLTNRLRDLVTPTSLSDPSPVPTSDGRMIRRLVYIADYDPNAVPPLTGADGNIYFIRAVIEGTDKKLETLVSAY